MPGGATVDGKTAEEFLRAGVRTVAEEISIVTLDEEIPQASLPAPDFIKIDIEGWEIEALRAIRWSYISRRCFSRCMARRYGRKGAKWPRLLAFCGRSTTGVSVT